MSAHEGAFFRIFTGLCGGFFRELVDIRCTTGAAVTHFVFFLVLLTC